MGGYIKSTRKSSRSHDCHETCDRCGSSVYYASEMKREKYTNMYVCPDCYDEPSVVNLASRVRYKDEKIHYRRI